MTPSASAGLVVSDVTKSYGDMPVLRGVSLTAGPGEAVAVVGPSGCGKSTLLHIIGSLDRPTSGTVRLGSIEVTSLSGPALAQFRAMQVGFVFQDHRLLPQLTALENVLLPTVPAGRPPGVLERARALLRRVGVESRADAFPAQLSGGERQRVAIARALINRPRLLLCDEPTGNLDRASGEAVVTLLLEAARSEGVILLMVTHNLEHARRLDRCLELADGRLAAVAGGV